MGTGALSSGARPCPRGRTPWFGGFLFASFVGLRPEALPGPPCPRPLGTSVRHKKKKKRGLTPDGRPLLRGVFEPTVPAGRRASRVPVGGGAPLPREEGEHRRYVSVPIALPRVILLSPVTTFDLAEGVEGRAGAPGLHRPPAPLAVSKALVCRTKSGRTHDNDPSAGSPTETLLRLLLPLDSQV